MPHTNSDIQTPEHKVTISVNETTTQAIDTVTTNPMLKYFAADPEESRIQFSASHRPSGVLHLCSQSLFYNYHIGPESVPDIPAEWLEVPVPDELVLTRKLAITSEQVFVWNVVKMD